MSLRSQASAVGISFVGSRRGAALAPAHRSAGYANEFIGNDPAKWRSNIPLFEALEERGLYPGIDISYHGNNAQFEYDILIHPGADPRLVVFRVGGISSLRITDQGDLEMTTPLGSAIQHAPVAFQYIRGVRTPVRIRFVIHSTATVGFALGAYNRSKLLTIDPILAVASYLGGNTAAEGHAVAVDGNGSFYVAGVTYSAGAGDADVLLTKVLASGSVVQSSFGGKLNDSANSIAVASDGTVFLAGRTSSADFPIAGGAYQRQFIGTADAFAARLSADNKSLIYSTYIGGSLTTQALGIGLGPNGTANIVGDTNSLDFPTSTGAFQTSSAGGFSGFLVSLFNDGSVRFATFIGGSGNDHANAIAVDVSGNSNVVGSTGGLSRISTSAFQTGSKGGIEGFAIKFDPNGNGIFSTYLGGQGDDEANAVALDAKGNLYIAGNTSSASEFPAHGFQNNYQGGGSDAFVLVLTADGTGGIWSTYLGTAGEDLGTGIALDGSGNVFVTGRSNADGFPVTSDALQPHRAGLIDAILCKFDPSGKLIYSSYFGGSGDDLAYGIAAYGGSVYLTGLTVSSDLPTLSAVQTQYGGGTSDAFYAGFSFTAGGPVVGAGGVVNGASFVAGSVPPGGIISIFGTNFTAAAVPATAIPLPSSLGGTKVLVNGNAIPLFYVGPTQINAQLPYETALGTASIVVTGATGSSAASSFNVVGAEPGIFVAGGQAAAQNQDYSINSASRGAPVGSTVTVYLTGVGAVAPAVATGNAAPASPHSFGTNFSATIAGVDATVSFLGLAPTFVGLAQANIVVPAVPAGNYPLIITVGDVPSAPANITVAGQ